MIKVENVINDTFIRDKIEEHVVNVINSFDDCLVTRFEYPEGSGMEWKIICEYANDDGDELTIKIKRRI